MRQRLRKILLENLALKLAALGITFVLFVVVRGNRDAVTTVHAKVVYVQSGDRVMVSEPVTELRITVRGPQGRLGRLDERDLEAVQVDLREVQGGELRFTEEMVRLPPGLRVESIHPSGIVLAFEERVERELPVQAVLAGEPAAGFRIARVTCDPPRVTLSGPRGVVERTIRALTRPLRIAEAREALRGEVELSQAPARSEWRPSGPVAVAVEVRPEVPPVAPPGAGAGAIPRGGAGAQPPRFPRHAGATSVVPPP